MDYENLFESVLFGYKKYILWNKRGISIIISLLYKYVNIKGYMIY